MKWLSRTVRSLYEQFEAYHAYGRPRLMYLSYIGIAGFLLFYLLRFTRPNPDLFDDLALRLSRIVFFLLIALKEYWPDRLKRYYTGYAYVALLYCLPFTGVLTALERSGGVPSISNLFIILVFIVLLTDWRNTLVMICIGTGLASLVYYIVTPNPHVPMDVVAQLPAFALILVGGNLFKFSTEQVDIERKLKATEALAGSIAHEMRNPLSQIRYVLERMRQAMPSPSPKAMPQALDARQVENFYRQLAEGDQAVNRGLQVIAMTLDEVSAKAPDSASFSLISAGDASAKAVQEYGYDSEEDKSRVRLVVVDDFEFLGVETAYLFVVFNLIKNALYYLRVKEDGLLTITVQAQEVRLHDNGPGLAPETIEHLFEPFRSVGKTGGTGLGLAYCQRVMTAFGGSITVRSDRGKFTEFILRMPAVSEQVSHAHNIAVFERARTAFQDKRLLVVDDSAALRASTVSKLRPLAAVIDEAGDGGLALEHLAARKYDLVVLDLNMPVLDGYDVAERIRQGEVPLNRDVCIVAYTSEAQRSVRVKTQKAGMDGWISKPCAQLPLLQGLVDAFEQSTIRPVAEDGLLAGRQVVLADDNTYNRKALAAYLHQVGVEVVEAAHGQSVLDLLAAGGSSWDAVLLDLNMPGMGGLETAQAIRRGRPETAKVPIIALTAHADGATVSAAHAAGMNGFLTKPVDAAVLYAKLLEVLGRGGADRQSELRVTSSSDSASALEAGGDDPVLLNLKRLESYRRIGKLPELLTDYFKESNRLLSTLELADKLQDQQECRDALHSLLGMSADAGAASLHQLVRRIYVPLVEDHQWPLEEGWFEEVRTQMARTDASLRAYAGMPAMDHAK